jgi:hypothetical protein
LEWQWGQLDAEMRQAVAEVVRAGVAPGLRMQAPKEPEKLLGLVHLHIDGALDDFCSYLEFHAIEALETTLNSPASNVAATGQR